MVAKSLRPARTAANRQWCGVVRRWRSVAPASRSWRDSVRRNTSALPIVFATFPSAHAGAQVSSPAWRHRQTPRSRGRGGGGDSYKAIRDCTRALDAARHHAGRPAPPLRTDLRPARTRCAVTKTKVSRHRHRGACPATRGRDTSDNANDLSLRIRETMCFILVYRNNVVRTPATSLPCPMGPA